MTADTGKNLNGASRGLALLAVMALLTFMATLFAAYLIITHTELGLAKSSRYGQSGFNAAEAGLNLRAEEIRGIFTDFGRPQGTSPSGIEACDSENVGAGDFVCRNYDFANNHSAMTYITEEAGNPLQRIIPPGEPFAGLNAMEYRYTVTSVGRSSNGQNEAILDLTFISRMVPLFQFAIFFQEDLEFFNGATMTVDGPVHTNSDLYVAPQTGGQTDYAGQITVAGAFYRGQKSQSSCTGYTGTARASNTADAENPVYVALPSCSSGRQAVSDVSSWNDNIVLDIDPVDVPAPTDMDAFSNGEYWERADLRLVLRLDAAGAPVTTSSPTGVEVVNSAGATMAAATTALHDSTCTGLITQGTNNYAVGTRGPSDSSKLRLFRERQYNSALNDYQRTLEIDMQGLLNCIQRFPAVMGGRHLNDDTEQGLVFFFAIDGPLSSASHNNYSVRIRNGARLQSNITGADAVQGLTVVTDQGLVIWGNYNSSGWVPAALLGDTLWLLSNAWTDADSGLTNTWDRDGSATTVYAAVLSGIKRTGNANGAAGRDQGEDSNGGGVINIFRFNEWFRTAAGGIPDFTYSGALVSLGPPRKSQSSWGPFTYYSAPNRLWSFDVRFNDANQLPPMTPVFVYLRQELFVRDYELH